MRNKNKRYNVFEERGKTKIGSTPSSDDCDDDEYLLGFSTNDVDDILVRLGDESSRSAQKPFPNLPKENVLMIR